MGHPSLTEHIQQIIMFHNVWVNLEKLSRTYYRYQEETNKKLYKNTTHNDNQACFTLWHCLFNYIFSANSHHSHDFIIIAYVFTYERINICIHSPILTQPLSVISRLETFKSLLETKNRQYQYDN